jgi:hypothetical protein
MADSERPLWSKVAAQFTPITTREGSRSDRHRLGRRSLRPPWLLRWADGQVRCGVELG